MASIVSTASGGILLVLALCGPAASHGIGSSGPFGNGGKPREDRHPLYGRIYEAYRKNLASGANLPNPVPVSGLLGYKRSQAQHKSEDEFPLELVKGARASAGGHTSGHDEPMRTASTESKRGRHGYDDDGYGDEGHYYGDDDEGYDYGYGDDGYGYGDDGYGYSDDGYGYGDDGYGYGYGDHRYDNTVYRYDESNGHGEKGERHGGGRRGSHSGKYATREGGYNGGGYRNGEGYTDTAACKCKNLGIIGSLAGFSTIPALVALVSQLTQSEARSARAFSSDIFVSEQRPSSSKETLETAVNGALKFLETHLLQRNSHPLTHSRGVRATRGLSVGHGNPHCQCTLGILGSIAGFASLTTLLGFALARAGSSAGGDVGGDNTRTSIKISDTRNITSQAVSSPSLAEGSSLIEGFPSLANLGSLRGNLSYSDLQRTSHLPLLFSSPPGSPDTVPSNVADHSIRKDQVGEQGIPMFSSQVSSKKGLTEGYQ